MSYAEITPRHKPYGHQLNALNERAHHTALGLLWEQGTGKTKGTIDNAAMLRQCKAIDAVIIIAPNGIHLNWSRNELPSHACFEYTAHEWRSSLTDTAAKRLSEDAMAAEFPWLCVNAEALRAKRCVDLVYGLLRKRRVLLVVDESEIIKNPSAFTTKAVTALGKHAKYRRILSGTPMTQSPMDLWSQLRFLDDAALGAYKNKVSFRTRFCREEPLRLGPRTVMKIVGGQNMDELARLVSQTCVRVSKKDCLDLPEKIYQTRLIPLSDTQRKMYEEMKKRSILELTQEQTANGVVSAKNVLHRVIVLHGITAGFIKTDEGMVVDIEGGNPRVEALIEDCSRIQGKIIIWCVYRAGMARAAHALREEFGEEAVVEYHGDVSNEERHRVIERMQNDPKCRFMVANKAAARGLTLTAASTCIYFMNSANYGDRAQSEDRIHRIGQRNQCLYIDYVAEKTVDERFIELLRNKTTMSDDLLVREWKKIFD